MTVSSQQDAVGCRPVQHGFTSAGPYPFILLNLCLSMLAAIQAPVIMMSQNRQDTKDRVRSELDYRRSPQGWSRPATPDRVGLAPLLATCEKSTTSC